MSQASGCENLTPDEAPIIWEKLSECVELFVEAWDAGGSEPDLLRFLPEGAWALRRMAMTELVKVDLEYRWRLGRQPKLLETYVAQLPQLAEGGVPCDLIYEEFHVRKQAGQAVKPDDYFQRFPAQADELRRLLGLEAPHLTTAMFGADAIEKFEPGHTIDDFELLSRLGRGAFATVFLARQKSMQRIVALKISADKGNEPQTLAQLDHPGIVRVYDQRQIGDRKLRLLYMQYIPGATLQAIHERVRSTLPAERSGKTLLTVIDEHLARRGELPPGDSRARQLLSGFRWPQVVCLVGARLAHALDYAHQHGVLHRDIKPANVLVAADASPKLVDFNISFSSKLAGATPTAYFGGSLAYMSPEQLEACNPAHPRTPAELDGQSDVYSLAVILWELLAGRRPFREEQVEGGWSATLTRMSDERRGGISPAQLHELPAGLPRGLVEALIKALAPEQANRFASAGQFGRELDLCLRPEAQRLLRPRAVGWTEMVRRWPFFALATAAVVPNAVLSVCNYYYNLRGIIARLQAEAQDSFQQEQVLLVNGVLYTVAIAVGVWFCWPVLRAVARRARAAGTAPRAMARTLANSGRGEAAAAPPAAEAPLDPRLLRRDLWLGDAIAWISFSGWVLSGIMFPLGLRKEFGPSEFAHFMTSQVLCGLMSTALVFFCVTFLVARVIHPTLVQGQPTDALAIDRLVRLARRVWLYFGLAVSAPFLAVTALVLIESNMRGAFGVLGLLGLLGFGVSFRLALLIRADLEATVVGLSPESDSMLVGSGTLDSFLTSTRRPLG